MTKKNYPQDFFKYAVELYNAHVEHVYHHCSNDWRLVSPDGCHYILSRFRIWHRLWSWHRYGTGTRSGKNKSYGCCVSVSRHQIAYILRFLRVHWTKLGREFSVSSAGQQYGYDIFFEKLKSWCESLVPQWAGFLCQTLTWWPKSWQLDRQNFVSN
jgi:hypothetical protein